MLFFFRAAEGANHADMLTLNFRTHPLALLIMCYKPNGHEAAWRYRTRTRLFRHFEARARSNS